MNRDKYYLEIAKVVSSRSKCLSRQIGAVLVRDDIIISTGYNGPPRGVPHCTNERIKVDEFLREALNGRFIADKECPRRVLGYGSGNGLEICPATHAEANAIIQAAKAGVSTNDSTLYLTCEFPCKSCLGLIINAGVRKIYCTENRHYDPCSKFMYDNSYVEVVTYERASRVEG
jgi:dCMP deaminase